MATEFRTFNDLGEKDVGVFLMESITTGLYHDPMNVLREYISNELDNDPPPKQIDVEVQANSVSVAGSGPGMDYDGIRTAIQVGFSPKDFGKNIGFRGIGIYSGVAIADTIEIVTKKANARNFYALHIDAKGFRADIENRKRIPLIESVRKNVKWNEYEAKPADSNKHGTVVTLKEILDQFEDILEEGQVRRYLENTAPVDFDPQFPWRKEIVSELKNRLKQDFRIASIRLNKNPVYRAPQLYNLDRPVFDEIRDRGKILAHYWLCQNAKNAKIEDAGSRGMLFRKKGFAIGNRSTVLKLFPKSINMVEWVSGEIHAVSPDLVPTSERVEFEPNDARKRLEKKIREEVGAVISRLGREKSALINVTERIAEATELPNKPQFGSREEWLDRLQQVRSLKDDLKNDASHPYLKDSKKKDAKRALNRTIAWLKKVEMMNFPPEQSSNHSEEDAEPGTGEEGTTPGDETEGPPATGGESELRVSEFTEEVSQLCSRIGQGEWEKPILGLVSIILDEGIVSDKITVRTLLQKLELALK
ncbi:MAG: ATP-binding protein [Nitrososphaerota archaeon]|nr:ATP-binding protein [Nitrososphaerota archaeon]